MNRALKAFVMWLLLLALPVQGYAAAMAAACAPARHPAGARHAMADGGRHQVCSSHGRHHDAGKTLASHEVARHHACADQHAGSTCGNCPACHVGAAPLASPPGLVLLATASILYAPAPSPRLPGVVPAGLERPPRNFPA